MNHQFIKKAESGMSRIQNYLIEGIPASENLVTLDLVSNSD
jgi:hypothetical protein